ncbi:hypothetical protein V5O48_018136 [Marasmius crinis-equi]|uniref:Uncharacterized protein n=1 Tax=Marasmius crinis-equi TaxID=585013 RepID=A0ABR3ELZ5_9AGAR
MPRPKIYTKAQRKASDRAKSQLSNRERVLSRVKEYQAKKSVQPRKKICKAWPSNVEPKPTRTASSTAEASKPYEIKLFDS